MFYNLILVFSLMIQCKGSGFFSLEVLRYQNRQGEMFSGSCCGNGKQPQSAWTCPPCPVFFHVCLREFQSDGESKRTPSDCTLGEGTSGVIADRVLTSGNNNRSLHVAFDFAWTRAFTLVLQARHRRNNGGVIVVEQSKHSSLLLPGADWHTVTFSGPAASITYRVRVRCAEHYYGAACTRFCQPRHDIHGHYTCAAPTGEKQCLPGWIGTNCETALCRKGCSPSKGSCDRPGECNCAFGWQGDTCEECVPYPGCKHGSCNGQPWKCFCDNQWAGFLCDQDLNYCGHHNPCINGGICENTEPDHYGCNCLPGYSGTNCELDDREGACQSSPCRNGGQCHSSATAGGERYVCSCPAGWTGRQCERRDDVCVSAPCLNGGSCVADETGGYRCECGVRWSGSRCQDDADECSVEPCVHAHSCSNHAGDYTCHCLPGWRGHNCDQNVDDCSGEPCENGATCVDMVAGFYCSCKLGFSGEMCETEIDECMSNPCKHGAECTDLIAAYTCVCPPGYSGPQCEEDTDLCQPDPCLNGAQCFSLAGDYYCQCLDGFEGKNCSHKKDHCHSHLCRVLDSCTISVAIGNSSQGSAEQLVTSRICGEHGRCVSTSTTGFECECEEGYAGELCQENIDDCMDSPCRNHGTCVDGVNAFQCICQAGWEGKLCEINTDDCLHQPCRNQAKCIDLVTDYRCQCVGPWRGKRCHLAVETGRGCDPETCANGGKCTEDKDSKEGFLCACQSPWSGPSCTLSQYYPCESSPCQHGATCVNTGDTFSCICPLGYDGLYCEDDVNNCQPFPCYNGGKCIDGVNWYRCDCAAGFAGPDCRINLNECLSNPCAFGATCVDGAGQYSCLCPPRRSGIHCDVVLNAPPPRSCVFERRLFHHGHVWQDACNTCVCADGKVQCTKLWCGQTNCLAHVNNTERPQICADDQMCVMVETDGACFLPPCLPWGTCQLKKSLAPVLPYHHCLPNTPINNGDCAKITLQFDKTQLPSGVFVESICSSVRALASVRSLARQQALVILCAVKVNEPSSIELTIQSGHHNHSRESDVDKFIYTAANSITRIISQHSSNITAHSLLTAVIQVQLKTFTVSVHTVAPAAAFIPVVCSLLGFIGLLSILCLIVWKNQYTGEAKTAQHLLGYQRSNNDDEEAEEHVTRYHNPLFESELKDRELSANNILRAAALASPTAGDNSKYLENIYKSVATDTTRTDIEKYEKSPFKSSPACVGGKNLYEVKATNVELSRTRCVDDRQQQGRGSLDSIII